MRKKTWGAARSGWLQSRAEADTHSRVGDVQSANSPTRTIGFLVRKSDCNNLQTAKGNDEHIAMWWRRMHSVGWAMVCHNSVLLSEQGRLLLHSWAGYVAYMEPHSCQRIWCVADRCSGGGRVKSATCKRIVLRRGDVSLSLRLGWHKTAQAGGVWEPLLACAISTAMLGCRV